MVGCVLRINSVELAVALSFVLKARPLGAETAMTLILLPAVVDKNTVKSGLNGARMYFQGGFTLPKPQRLHQKYERDCGVSVFAALAGVSEEEVLADLPTAYLGIVTVDGWIGWLESKGFTVLKREECPADIVPCAHLVANALYTKEDAHWVFRDEDGDMHDPSPVAMCWPANDDRMRNLETYSIKILTLSVERKRS